MKPKRMLFPMASPFGKRRSARLLFTMAIRACFLSSVSLKSRPRSSGIASVRIGGHLRNRVVPTLRAGDCCVPKANRTNSRQAGDARQELHVVTVQVQVLVAAGLGIQGDFEQALLLETEIDGTQFLKASCQKSRAEQQNQREGNLRNNERFAQVAGASAQVARILL